MATTDVADNPRHQRLFSKLKTILLNLSGTELEELDRQSSFLELGFDSLFLIQMSTAIKSELKVNVSFRQLIEEIESFEGLLEYLNTQVSDEHLPSIAEKSLSKSDETVVQSASPQDPVYTEDSQVVPTVRSSLNIAISHNRLESLISHQLELMSQQLEMLKRGTRTSSFSTPTSTDKMPLKTVEAQTSATIPMTIKPGGSKKQANKSFGAIARITRGKTEDLSSSQQQWLDSFIHRYNKRTARSKEYTEQHRPHMADPRVVTGFKSKIKELIYPIVVDRTEGCHIWDADGNDYVDALNGFGSNFFGYRHPKITQAIVDQLWRGAEIGPQPSMVGNLAKMICRFTGLERAAFCNTGSEAVMGAMRMARTITGRSLIAIFTGSYHGIFDEVLVRGTKNLRSVPAAPGILPSSVENVLVLDYGTDEALNIIREHAHELAAVMIEPIQSRRPDLRPREFLHAIRAITEESGSAFIFDEVVTGFRLGPGGAQQFYGIQADIATYGKVIGGGMPIGVMAGKAKFMDALDGGAWSYGDESLPEVSVTYFAGTFVRHPAAMAACQAALEILQEGGEAIYRKLNEQTSRLCSELNTFCRKVGVPINVESFSSLWRITYTEHVPYGELLFFLMRQNGIHIYDGFPCFLTMAHTDTDVDRIITACQDSIHELQEVELLPNSLHPDMSSSHLHSSLLTPDRGNVEGQKFSTSSQETIAENDSSKRQQNSQCHDRSESPLNQQFPLTEAQKEIWLASHMSEHATCAYNEPFLLHLSGPLNIRELESSVQTVFLRHDALHVHFEINEPYQKQIFPNPIHIPFLDYSSLDSQARLEHVQKLLIRIGTTPFNFARDPLVRAYIVKLAAHNHMMVFSAHHIVCDGWSWNVLFREISAVYSAKAQGQDYDLLPAASYRTYVENEIKEHNSEKTKESYSYWLNEYRELPLPLELPLDRARPPTKTYNGATVSSFFDPQLFQKVKEIAARQNVSLFSLTFATYNLLLGRLSNQYDLVVVIPTAGQLFTSTDALVGHCVNSFPVRSRFNPNMSFAEFLSATSTKIFDMYDNQGCTLGGILKRLKIPRDPSRLPLSDVTFNLDRNGQEIQFYGLEASVEQAPKQAVHFDLFFNLNELSDQLRVDIDYNRDLWDEQTIQQWLNCYTRLLEGIVKDPEMPIFSLPLLNEDERRAVCYEADLTQSRNFSQEKCLHELFEAQVAQKGSNIAVVFDKHRLTYETLNQKANQVAHYLQKLGVGSETMVGLFMERSIEMVVGLLGILKAGGAYVPLDPIYPQERLRFMLNDAQIPIVVTQASLKTQLPEQEFQVVTLDTDWGLIAQESFENTHVEITPDQLAYVIYTSGSTGNPKGCMVTHRNVTRLYQNTEDWFHFTDQDVWTLFHSSAFDFSVWEMWGAWLYGGRLVIIPYKVSRTPEQFYDLLIREQVTVLNQTPSAFVQLIQANQGRKPSTDFKLRFIIFGGEKLECHQLQPWIDRYGDTQPQLINMYGITETTIFVTYRPVKATDCSTPSPRSAIGRPISDLELYILDEYLQPVPFGVQGEMYIGGAGVTRGYLNRPELTQERFIQNPFNSSTHSILYKSGDLAKRLPNGELEFIGRSDNQIKIRGFRVELGEIEAVLTLHPAVSAAVVIAKDMSNQEKRLLAYLVSSQGLTPSTSELRDFLSRSLPFYMIPAAFIWLSSIPLTPNGKVDQASLPAENRSLLKSNPIYIAPRTPLESQLKDIWEQVFGRQPIGVTDNFFDLGGESLIAVRLTVELERVYQEKIPVPVIFQTQTIEQLAYILRQDKAQDTWTWLAPIKTSGSKPPLFCVIFGRNFHPFLENYPDQPLYTFFHQNHDGYRARYLSVEDMATAYLKEMRTVQPHGPYYLAGFSFGGVVAYEMAQQLRNEKEDVRLLILLDPTSPPSKVSINTFTRVKNFFAVNRPNGDTVSKDEKIKVGLILTKITHGITRRIHGLLNIQLFKRGLCQFYFTTGNPLPPTLRSFYCISVSTQAAKFYNPQQYQGEMVLFSTDQCVSSYWGSLCQMQNLRIFNIQCDHLELLTGPQTEIVCNHVMQCLQETQNEKMSGKVS